MPRGTSPTPAHLAALAKGRAEGKAIRDYLDALSAQNPRKRGRQPKDAAAIKAQIDATTDPVERIKLRPALRDAMARESRGGNENFEEVQESFIKHVVGYSERFGLTYADWREEGVAAAVLKQAGMTRGGS
jgi:hypothetical protein